MKTHRKANPKQARGKVTAKSPKWMVDDPETLEATDAGRKDCPAKYRGALYYLCDEMACADFEGRGGELLNNPAIMEALEVVTDPQSVGMDEKSLKEMAADLTEETARYRAEDDRLLKLSKKGNYLKGLFLDDKIFDDEIAANRRYFLRTPNMEWLLPELLEKENIDMADVAACLKRETLDDGLLKNIRLNPMLIVSHWLNNEFAFFADKYLLPWLDYVELPRTFATEKLRATIADNFGLFPFPFEYVLDREGNGTIIVSKSLTTLLHLLRIAAERQAATGRKRRKSKGGISQKAFAEHLGVSVKTVQNWDNGKTKPDGVTYVPKAYLTDSKWAVSFIREYKFANAGRGRRNTIVHDPNHDLVNKAIADEFIRNSASKMRSTPNR